MEPKPEVYLPHQMGEGSSTVSVSLPATVAAWLNLVATVSGVSVSEVIRRAIDELAFQHDVRGTVPHYMRRNYEALMEQAKIGSKP